MIKNYKEFINESNSSKTKIDLSKATDEVIDSIINIDELNDAMYELQSTIGQTDGGVCGMFFSDYDDAENEWLEAGIEERKKMTNGYLKLEGEYSTLSDDGDDDDFTEKWIDKDEDDDEDVSTVDVSKATDEVIDRIIKIADLDDAMAELQSIIGQTDGGNCGMYFSSYDDSNYEWLEAGLEERREMTKGYLKLEALYTDM